MRTYVGRWAFVIAVSALWVGFGGGPAAAQPVSPVISYQGRLLDAGEPYHGFANIAIRLYDVETGGEDLAEWVDSTYTR